MLPITQRQVMVSKSRHLNAAWVHGVVRCFLEVIVSTVTEAAERLRQWNTDQFTHSMQVVERDRAMLADAYLTEHLPDDKDQITEDWINSLSPQNRTLTIEYWIRDGRVTIGSVCGCDIVPSIVLTKRGQLRRLIAALSLT